MPQKKRRIRRTNYAIEKDIMRATKQLIEEKGFVHLTLTGVVKKAGIEPSVFYNRFKDLDSLIEHFTRTHDYWLTSLNDYGENIDNNKEYIESIYTALIKDLYKNKSMQQLLIWELTEDNRITREAALVREKSTNAIAQSFDEYFKKNGINLNFRATAAVIIAGIYYLILHKDRSTFSGINFNSREGKNLLIETAKRINSLIFKEINTHKETIRIAINLKNTGIDHQTICKCTGLSTKEVANL